MRPKFRCQMCGECCKRYIIPVNLFDIRRIREFTKLEPAQFLQLITPDKSVAYTYYDIPKIEFCGRKDNVLALKDTGHGCIFLGVGKCKIYDFRPLKCRPFPFVYEREGGEITFSINEESAGFCKGLERESTEFDFSELKHLVAETEMEQEALSRKVGEWNAGMANQPERPSRLSDLLKFLLPDTRYV